MKMIINGIHCDSSDGKTIDVLNAASQTLIESIPDATKDDVDKALVFAKKGAEKWGNTPLYERISIIYKFSNLLDANAEKIAGVLCEECGKPISQALSETKGAAFIFRCYAERARSLMGDVHPVAPAPNVEKDVILCIRKPLGVVVCIIPFNYPVDLYAEKVAPALVMGNSVVVKPSTDAPLANIMMTELLLQAGVPGDAIQIITGKGERLGKWLCDSLVVDAVSLTGSTQVGVETMMNSSKFLHKVELELGGNDPFIICNDADVDLAVEETLAGRIVNAGQTCCGSKRFLVQSGIYDKFLAALTHRFENLIIGDPKNPETELGSMINEASVDKLEKQIAHTVEQGARVHSGGERISKTYYQPTILVDVTREMDIAKDMEVFGPVVPIIRFETVEEAIEIANQTCYGLQSGVMTLNMTDAFLFGSKLECGCVTIGGCGNYRSVLQPFGGWKMSGNAHEGVGYTLEEMSKLKTIAFKKVLL